jgi:hypothetical protein
MIGQLYQLSSIPWAKPIPASLLPLSQQLLKAFDLELKY